ncbi:MAG: glycosyltransferase [Candidatus Omnitrophica bacterium]|nr:glycosyltransferase [Candidatus Omnitrophota bacterium]
MSLDLVIATYNRPESLSRTLKSIEAIERPHAYPFRVIIADNSTQEDTKNFLKNFLQQTSLKIFYFQETTKGKVYALNHALTYSDADLIAFTDDDITFDSHWLKQVIENFTDSNLHCLTGKVEGICPAEKPLWYSARLRVVIGAIEPSQQRGSTLYAAGSNMIFRRQVLKEVEGFILRDQMGHQHEDSVLSQRIRARGYAIIYDPSVAVYHHFQTEHFNKKYFRRWYLNSGKALAELNQKEEPHDKKIFDIPRWWFRWAISHAFQMIFFFYRPDQKFFHELQLYRFTGFCQQRWKRAHKK